MTTIKIAIINYEHALASSVLGLLDIFSIVNHFCLVDKKDVMFHVDILHTHTNIHNFNIQIDFNSKALLQEMNYDIIIIPPLIDLEHKFETNTTLLQWLQKQYQNKTTIASVCVGAYILAQAGLLDDKQATSHWVIEKKLKQDFPKIKLMIDKLIVEDGNIITAGGVSAYIDLALYITRKFISKEVSYLCANYLGVDAGRTSQKHYKNLTILPSNNENIQKVLEHLKEYFKEPITIKDMAKYISVSQRTFLRYFKKATGESPNQYLQKLRVEESKRLLLCTHDSFEYITYCVGYSNTSSFRNLFKKLTGLTPGEYRDYFMIKS
jgi:transcriptional regulator GlxA family with amidase domain